MARVVRMPILEAFERLGTRLQRAARRVRAVPVEVPEVAEVAEIEAPTAQLVARFTETSKITGALAAIAGYHALLGWLFGIDLLRTPSTTVPMMTANEAVIALLYGAALYLPRAPPTPTWAGLRPLAGIAAALGTFLALLSVLEHVAGASLGLEAWVGNPTTGPSMPVFSTVAYLSIGAGILLLHEERRLVAAQVFGTVAAGLSLLAIACYVYGAPPFAGEMPLYTAIATLLASAGVVFFHSDRGLMAKVSSNSFGGVMARRILPATLLIPVVLGWVQVQGLRAGLYGFETGLAFLAVANVAVFVTVVWGSVVSLYRMDTKRRRAERELQETAAKLARSNADLEQFAYVASHDLKEPLRAISGSVQVLQGRLQPQMEPELEELIHHTVDGANRMQTLIDDLLTYSRLTTREEPLEPTDMGGVLREAMANLEVALRESRAVVTNDALPVVRADRTQMVQVLQNLLANALKYRSERTPKIHVGAEDAGPEWIVSVRDNGIGIAPQYADRIFKIFQRLHTRKDYPGTGIGLAVCKKVVERHGGRIWVESEPEEGSTFFFALPK